MKKFPDGSTHKRYDLRSVNGLGGWAVVFIGADGVFSTVSDYGDYGYFWGSIGEQDIRSFLLNSEKDPDYFRIKLDAKEEYDGPATAAAIRKHILEHRREKNYTKDFARREWDLLESSWTDPSDDFRSWYEETEIQDASEFAQERPRPPVVGFMRHVMPRLCAMLRAELAAESSDILRPTTASQTARD